MLGEAPMVTCNKAALAERPGTEVSMARRDDGLANCNAALADKIRAEDRTATLVNRGIILSASGQTAAAIADFDSALARDANLTDAYISRGSAQMRARNFSQARADFDTALTMGTRHTAIAYFNRGMASEEMGDLAGAYRDYRRAQSLAPNFAPVQAELARFQVTPKRVAQNR
jgi:tetratricopeptide (TPR) repeat protein